MQERSNVMLIDAGGGTVDISTYSFTSISPISLHELAPPDCKAPKIYIYFKYVNLDLPPTRYSPGIHAS